LPAFCFPRQEICYNDEKSGVERMAISQPPIYQEVYHFLASAPSHDEILAFRPSPTAQERIRALLNASKEQRLSADEQAKLNEFEQVEHFVRMLKAHTRQLIDRS
jgi:hypothetical protein